MDERLAALNAARRAGAPDPQLEAEFAEAATRFISYGTLRPGEPNAHVMAPAPGVWRAVTLRGEILRLAHPSLPNVPGFVPDPAGAEVPAELLHAAGLPAFWPELDLFEGPNYVRVLHTAQFADGTEVIGNLYILGDPDRHR